MRFHLRSDLSFEDIAKMINAKAGAWAAYYGRFRPLGDSQGAVPHRPVPGARGPPQVQAPTASTSTSSQDPGQHQTHPARTPSPLAMGDQVPNGCNTSRMMGAR